MNEFFNAIYEKTTEKPYSDFYTSIGGRFTYGEAMEQCGFSYAVFFGLPASNADTFCEEIEDLTFQVNIYAKTYPEAGKILGYCRALFHDQTLSVSGYRDVTLTRGLEVPPVKDGDKWRATIEFNGLLQTED